MAQKCVHQGCGKIFSDAEEPCHYHPGPPIFHEGQKGWKCCKSRVLTFDEFLSISPCTIGKHSTTDLPPAIEKKQHDPANEPEKRVPSLQYDTPRAPVPIKSNAETNKPPPSVESEVDDPKLEIPKGKVCRRRACGALYSGEGRDNEICQFHPGAPIFHEGSKGYTCCKRRVLEFDEFMKIKGCKTKESHLFIGSGEMKDVKKSGEETLEAIRYNLYLFAIIVHDFYQTADTVIASFFLRNIDQALSQVEFRTTEISLNLITSDISPKRYQKTIPLFGVIDPEKSTYRILGMKLEVKFVKAICSSWSVLRGDEQPTGDIIQAGRARKF
ncbi:Cysteine and histidine-rich domain-containing protein [Golovinomyces cichoracearum]|uniref:Cysteine and histidine-rich domain-containing protein n=1 Tax=Golovinomyces cichoracearum TaxID=62708 RepID=A0A420HZC7_9PEZI|nr:Cysteine and histidine-rich domain-containing protein [Golovinomyces cichoracearum]